MRSHSASQLHIIKRDATRHVQLRPSRLLPQPVIPLTGLLSRALRTLKQAIVCTTSIGLAGLIFGPDLRASCLTFCLVGTSK